jgi:hypothetical protein
MQYAKSTSAALAQTLTPFTVPSLRWRRRGHSPRVGILNDGGDVDILHDCGDVLSLHESIEVERPHELLISIRAENTHPAVVLEGLIKRHLDKGSPKLNKPKIYFSLP